MSAYPVRPAARDRFVLERRGPRLRLDPRQPQGITFEEEPDCNGRIGRSATVFLTGRECPWRCVMCDLWKGTLPADTPPGAIPAQLASARAVFDRQPPPIATLKLYNAGSFFDPRAVPEGDYAAVASRLAGFSRVVVESHPSLVGPRVERFLGHLHAHGPAAPRLEVAMGLETVHPGALERLYKRMSVAAFARAAERLARYGADVRVFLLIAPPFIPPTEQDGWLLRSIDTAFACGASVVSLIPVRPGNGAMEALEAQGLFRTPVLHEIERAVDLAHAARRPAHARLFVDTWDLQRFTSCRVCGERRRDRLHAMNLAQRALPPVPCACAEPA